MAQAPNTYTGTARFATIGGAIDGGYAIAVDYVEGNDNFKAKVESKDYIYVKKADISVGPAPHRVKRAHDVDIIALKYYSFTVEELKGKLYVCEGLEQLADPQE